LKPSITFINPVANFTILGITLLSPNQPNQVIDRDANYRFLDGAYADAGYPIYFERSINPAVYNPMNSTTNRAIDSNVAYVFEYSLDNGAT